MVVNLVERKNMIFDPIKTRQVSEEGTVRRISTTEFDKDRPMGNVAMMQLDQVIKIYLVGLAADIRDILPRSIDWIESAISKGEEFGVSHGGQYGETPEEWRKDVISFACDMSAAGLVMPLPGIENYQGKSSAEIRDLLQQGDLENGLDADLVWDVIHFSGTQKLLELLRMFELNNWQATHSGLSQSFGRALAEMDVVRV